MAAVPLAFSEALNVSVHGDAAHTDIFFVRYKIYVGIYDENQRSTFLPVVRFSICFFGKRQWISRFISLLHLRDIICRILLSIY